MVRLNSPLAETSSARDYIDIMSEIKKLEAFYHEFEENNPTIIVFGDQSSGKSTVLQRLTGGLPLPRGSTKSTVAPFKIRMLQSEEPLHKISLRYVENKNREPIHPSEVDFAVITDLDELEIEEKLREAQRYVQNPSIDFKNERLPPDNDELSYTKNVVCVTISGPEQMYNLSLVDLPGITRSDENNEAFVLSLVNEYIKKESTILVPVFQATSDIATQCACRLARETDPNGQRTVGVLTKIDRIVDHQSDDEKHLELATLVKGQGLVNGTYVIRNPSSVRSEIHEDPDELEKETIRKLKQHIIWEDVPFDRFGLQNLTMKLSDLQRKEHKRSLPKIRSFLEDRRSEFEEKLNALPLPLDTNSITHYLSNKVMNTQVPLLAAIAGTIVCMYFKKKLY
ncbi:P-loop containing nucleoside triphosphate hydrolase protein [Rhizophagus diaphanus]|nr:P-loop containing nucleoside triphosphate hydrolase protein [Rhizophagus diaphanus] [Rhizophagus sp. MUCL 43196]